MTDVILDDFSSLAANIHLVLVAALSRGHAAFAASSRICVPICGACTTAGAMA